MGRISETAAAAKKAGMSYGMYVAMLREAEQERLKSERHPARIALPAPDPGEVAWVDPFCFVCGASFVPKRKTQVCCSPECQRIRVQRMNAQNNRDRYRRAHGIDGASAKVCPVCGKAFESNHSGRKYCSDACAYEAHLQMVTARQQRLREK